MEVFQKVIIIIIGIFGGVGVILLFFTSEQERTMQASADYLTEEFISSVATNGYLSAEMWDTYITKLSSIGIPFDIEISNTHEVFMPELDQYGHTVPDKAVQYSETFYTDDILSEVQDSGKYAMAKSDIFYIKLKASKLCFASKLRSAILLGRSLDSAFITVERTCMIRDEAY